MANGNGGKKNGKSGNGMATGVGAGLVAAAAAAGAGYYFYFSKEAKAHRKVAAKWATDLKREVVRQAKKAKELEQDTVHAIVDKAAAAYRGVKSIDAAHLMTAAGELKDNWTEIKRELAAAGRRSKALVAGTTRKVRSVAFKAKSTAKRAGTSAKKAVKKATKKPVSRKSR
jgi:hypothetical protein